MTDVIGEGLDNEKSWTGPVQTVQIRPGSRQSDDWTGVGRIFALASAMVANRLSTSCPRRFRLSNICPGFCQGPVQLLLDRDLTDVRLSNTCPRF